MPQLDLKFVAHYGQAVVQEQFGRRDLTGAAVIAAHRLLKNTVSDQLGLRGYALISEACAVALGLNCVQGGMRAHAERYDVGDIKGYVQDMESRWRTVEETDARRVVDEEVFLRVEVTMPAPPPVVWDWLTTPSLRIQWQHGATRIDQTPLDGRVGVGTVNHCVHGKDVMVEEVVEWHPFDSFTDRTQIPEVGAVLTTFDLQRTTEGTQVTFRMSGSEPGPEDPMWPMVAYELEPSIRQGVETLRELLTTLDPEPVGSGAGRSSSD